MDYREAYEKWRRDFADDEQVQRELDAIRDNEDEIRDRFYTELTFGTAGLRGILGAGLNRMNRYNIRRATAGLADYINEQGMASKGVVIAYDSRHMSPEFALEAALVLAANGVAAQVFPSLRPVPVLSFAVRELGAAAGIAVTASHNPPQYNGYKVYWADGAQLSPERADAVFALIGARTYQSSLPMDEARARAEGLLKAVDPSVDERYISKVKTLAVAPEMIKAHGGEIKIVYTPLHGAGNIPVRRVLAELGFTQVMVVPEQEMPDGDFPTVKVPNPEYPETLSLAVALAEKEGADICLATDPDCDRLGIATRGPDGAFVLLNGNQIGCLLLYHILSGRKRAGTLPENGAAVKSIVSSELTREIARGYGMAMVETLTGFKFIAEQIQAFEETGEHTFLFGYEEAHGYLSSTFVRDKDGVNAALLAAELALTLKLEGKTLWDGMQDIYRRFGFVQERAVSVQMPGSDGMQCMAEIMQRLRDNPPRSIAGLPVMAVRDYETGIRTDESGKTSPLTLPKSNVLYYELGQGRWLCIRPSGTEPKIKAYAGARAESQEEAAALADRLEHAAKELLA